VVALGTTNGAPTGASHVFEIEMHAGAVPGALRGELPLTVTTTGAVCGAPPAAIAVSGIAGAAVVTAGEPVPAG
jgi:hypothetical protein